MVWPRWFFPVLLNSLPPKTGWKPPIYGTRDRSTGGWPPNVFPTAPLIAKTPRGFTKWHRHSSSQGHQGFKGSLFSRTCRKWNNFDIMISSENLRNSESPSSTILRSKVFSQIWKTQRISASVWVDLKQGAKVVLSAHGMKHRIW